MTHSSPSRPSRRRTLLVALAPFFVAGAVRAVDCEYEGQSHQLLKDSFRNIGFTLCRTHFASGSAAHTAVLDVIDELNSVQSSGLYFYVEGWDDHKSYHDLFKDDGANRLDLGSCPSDVDDCDYSGRCIQRTNMWGRISEFDIQFKSSVSWNYGQPTSWNSSGSFQNTALHEIGHGLGFAHTKQVVPVVNIMGANTGKWVGDRRPGLKAYDTGHIHYHYSDGSNGRPDLVLSNFTTEVNSDGGYECVLHDAVSEAALGGSITIRWTRMNRGSQPARSGYRTRVYLSTDDTLDSGDREVKSWTLTSSVDEFSTEDCSTDITIPSDLPGGTYHVILHIDADDDVGEYDETNNVLPLHQPLWIRGEIDLAVTRVEVAGPYEEHISEYVDPADSIPGYYSWRTVTFKVEVQNLHDLNTAMAVEFAFSYDDMWTDTGVLTTSQQAVPELAPGEAYELRVSVDIPISAAGKAIGTTDLNFVVDPYYTNQDVQKDTDRGNNMYFMRIDDDWFRPDYVLELDEVTLSGEGPYDVLVDFTVRNQGPETAGSSTLVGVYDDDGSLLTAVSIPPLDAAGKASRQVELRDLVMIPLRKTSFVFEADTQNLITEQDEENNSAVISFGTNVDPDTLIPREWVLDIAWRVDVGSYIEPELIVPERFQDYLGGTSSWVQDYFTHAGNGPFLPDARVLELGDDWLRVDAYQYGTVDLAVRAVAMEQMDLVRTQATNVVWLK